MNIKWIHTDGYKRAIYLASGDNFDSFLAKMQKKVPKFHSNAYFYIDEDGDKMLVDDELAFGMMVEYFGTIPANKPHIHSYVKEIQGNEKQQPNENSISPSIEFPIGQEFDGFKESGENGNSMDNGDRNLKIFSDCEVNELIGIIERGIINLFIESKQFNGNADLVPLETLQTNPQVEYELVGILCMNKKKLAQLANDIITFLIKNNKEKFAVINIVVHKERNINQVNNAGNAHQRSHISIDSNGSKNSRMLLSEINVIDANMNAGNYFKWWNFWNWKCWNKIRRSFRK